MIRTAENPLRSRPSRPLAIMTGLIVVVGLALPFILFVARLFGFVPLPGLYFLFLAAMILTYLFLVEAVKRPIMRRS